MVSTKKKEVQKQLPVTIKVKNVDGDPDTVAEILIQNKIDYTPKVSVVMPVYNVEPYLRQCLDSVTSQTLKEIEIICVDDGSTDASLDILKEYAAKDNRITVITQKNAGSGKARNNAINNAIGEFIAFMDSDDMYPSEKTLEHMYKAAIDNDILICGGGLNQLKDDGELITNPKEFESEFSFEKEGIIQYSDYQFDYGYWRFIYNRKFLKENQLYFPDYLRQQDPPFCVKAMALAGKFYAIPEPTYVYRISYKQIQWTERKAIDLFKGIRDCLEYSKQYNLQHLHVRIAQRLNTWTFRTAVAAMMKFKSVRMQALEALHSIDYDVLKKQNIQLELDDIYKALLKSEENDVLVSIILPVYNVEPYLARCLDSILKQTLPCFEVICVDDGGSVDKSIEILNEYARKDKRIKIVNKGPGNLSAARNFGLKYAQNDFIMFVDSDDWIDETTLEKAVAKMSGQVDLVCWGAKLVDESDGKSKENIAIGNIYHQIRLTGEKEATNYNILQSTYTAWNKLLKKSILDEYQIEFAEGRLFEDNDFSIMYMVHCRHIYYLDEYLYYYVQRPNSLMDKIRARECRKTVDNLYSFDNIYHHLEKYGLLDNRKEVIATRYSIQLSAAYKYAPDDLRRSICNTAEKLATDYRKELFWNETIEKLEKKQYNQIRECVELIISLTSYPARIKTVNQTIESLLNQSMKADKVILWLAPEQFPGKEADLPQELLDLRDKGLTIGWYKDIRSYKKLIPTLKLYPNAIIVTSDDDALYDKNWLSKLFNSYVKYPNSIQCHRAHKVVFSKKEIKPYKEWLWHNKLDKEYNSYSLFFTGLGGVLYPPHCLSENVLSEEKFKELCPQGDDIWFWANAIMNGTKIKLVENPLLYPKLIDGTQETALWLSNVENNQNDIQIQKVVREYPEILKILNKEKRHSIFHTYLLFPYYLYRIKQLKNRYKEISFNNILKRLRGFRVDIRNTGNFNNAVEIIGKDISVKNITWNTQNGQGKFIQGNAFSNKITIKAIKSGVLEFDLRGQEYKYDGKRFPVWIDYKSIKIDGKEILSEPTSVWHDKPCRYEIPAKDGQEIILEIEQQYHEYTEDELKDIVLKFGTNDDFISDNKEEIVAKLKEQLPTITNEEGNQRKYNNTISEIISALTSYRLDIKNIGSAENALEILVTDGKVETPRWFSNPQGIGKVIQGKSMNNTIKLKVINDGRLQIKFRGQEHKVENNRIPIWIDYKSIKVNSTEILSKPLSTWYYKSYDYEMPIKTGQEILLEIEQQYHEYTENEIRHIILKLSSDDNFVAENMETIIRELKKQLPIIDEETQKQKEFDKCIANTIHNLVTYRLDIKNIGSADNTLEIWSTDGKVDTPKWLSDEHGIGKILHSNAMSNTIKIKAVKNGVLHVDFRSQDYKFNDKRVPIWIDYKSIKIDGKEILKSPIATWHDKPYLYDIPVKDGQEITLEIEQQYHQYTEDELKDVLLKSCKQPDNITNLLEFYKNNVGFKEIEYTWEYVKNNILTQNPVCTRVDDIKKGMFGRLLIDVNNTKFESVLIPSKTKKLYVFLGGYSDKNGEVIYPLFARISWCDKFDGMSLYLDDPTRIEHNYSPSYYFGNKKQNYLNYVRDIVQKIAHVYEISNDSIVFIGSSHTGFCALYLANEILFSKCIALCPQVDVKTLCREGFEKAMGVSCDDTNLLERLNVLRILNNEKSKFFIFSNVLCNHDRKQMELLYNEANKELSLGLSELSSTTKCLLAEIYAISPHHVQPDEYFSRMIETIMDQPITPSIQELCNCFVGEMKRYYALNKKFVEATKDSTT